MKVKIDYDRSLFIEMLTFAHLMIYESKTVVVSKNAKSIMKRFRILFKPYLKENYIVKKDMICCKEHEHTWWAYIKDTINPENIMGVFAEKLLFILDNPTPEIRDAAIASCTDEYSGYIIIEDEE